MRKINLEPKPGRIRHYQAPKKLRDSIPLALSAISVLVALSSLALSFDVQNRLQAEAVEVRLTPYSVRREAVMRSLWPPQSPATLQVFWSVIISNTGERKLSIVDYEVQKESAHNEPWPTYLNRRLYLDGGILNSDGQPWDLPVALEPGESLRLSIKVGLVISPESHSVLSKKYAFDEPLTLDKIIAELAESGIDIYGNKVSLVGYDREGYANVDGPGPERREEKISLIFRTGRGSVFTDSSSWYDH